MPKRGVSEAKGEFCFLGGFQLTPSRVGKASLVVVHWAASTWRRFSVRFRSAWVTVEKRCIGAVAVSSVAVGRAFLTLASRLVRRHFSPPSLTLSSTKKEATKRMFLFLAHVLFVRVYPVAPPLLI